MKVISLNKQEQKNFDCRFCDNDPVVMIVRTGIRIQNVTLCPKCYKTK